jgi:hypothetical protein
MKPSVMNVLSSLLVAVIVTGCAAAKNPLPAAGPATAKEASADADVLTPFMVDPAFVVRYAPPPSADWSRQRNLSTPPGVPDISLRLTHRATGAEIDFMFVNNFRPADFAAHLRGKLPEGATATSGVIVTHSGNRAGFTAKGVRDGKEVLSRTEVIRQPAMTNAALLVAAEWPPSADAMMRDAFAKVVDSVQATAIGPSDPRVDLAMCLTQKGYRYYGASWCGYCDMQEKSFGPGYSRLRAVDCSPPDSQGKMPECVAEEITTFPTWILPDGSKMTGLQSLETLAEKSGCPYAAPK